MRRTARGLILAAAVVLVLGAPFSAQASPFFMGLGALTASGPESLGRGVSADGTVAVGASVNTTGRSEAFRWTQAGGIVGLGDLSGALVLGESQGASADGSVVVGTFRTDESQEAFRWTQADGIVGLDDLPGGTIRSQGWGVSADGAVVVGDGTTASFQEAFRWTQAGGMVGLGDLTGEGSSTARSVSADGSVVVGRSSSALGQEAFRWTSGGGMVGLGDLAGGTFEGIAHNVSADGAVVVGESNSAAGPNGEAFRWTQAGAIVGLGDLPGGSFRSRAWDTSDNGAVVVGWSSAGAGGGAFIWDAVNNMRSLQDVLVNDFGLDLTGWTLDSADAISDNGLTIVGHGTNPSGNTEGWIAHIEPPPGDGNGDGKIDGADYLIWADHFGDDPALDPPGSPENGDYNDDGVVDGLDYLLWASNFGMGPNDGVAVPEPGAFALFVMGVVMLSSRRCRRGEQQGFGSSAGGQASIEESSHEANKSNRHLIAGDLRCLLGPRRDDRNRPGRQHR